MMSAANRGGVRVDKDFYATPEWCTEAVLSVMPSPPAGSIVTDPCAGDGAILRVVKRTWPDVYVAGIEIDKGRALENGFANADALEVDSWAGDICVTNPPYSLSFEFAQRAVRECKIVAMLLRINWLAGVRRAGWLMEHTPAVYVLSRRPSFTGSGTDACDYAWMVWGLGHSQVQILGGKP